MTVKYLLLYIDSYDRSEHYRTFESKDKLDEFIKRDTVHNVINIYELKEVK